MVLKTLSKSQQAVQAGHALAKFIFSNFGLPDTHQWNNGDLIYLKASSMDLLVFESNLNNKSISFDEPDLHDRLTAVAMLGEDNDPRFIDYRLV